MNEVKWIKIVTDIFDDEKILLIESLPEADSSIVIWFKLLCLAGKQNNSGVFVMNNGIAYTDKMLAAIFRRKETIVNMALKTFEQFGMIEIIDNAYTIPNWNKHQTLDAYEKKKQRDRLYQAERRAFQKALINKSSDVAVSDKEKEIDKDNIPPIVPQGDELPYKPETDSFSESFNDFWKAYPKKVSKANALKAWKKLKPNNDLVRKILYALEKQKKSSQWQKDNGQFIPYPATWLNGRRWEDEQHEESSAIPNYDWGTEGVDYL